MADDLASVFVNGKQVGEVYKLKEMKWQYEFFPISLKSGWNPVMVKCADVSDDWNFTFGIGDPESRLKFAIQAGE
jgi:hypothetical protein